MHLGTPFCRTFGRSFAQPFYNRLHRFALAGMNCGLGAAVDTSGEVRLIQRLSTLWDRRDSLIFFDVGANQGDYSMLLLEYFKHYPQLKIFAFEPSPTTFEKFTKRFEAQIANGRVRPIPLALGHQESSQPLYSTGDSSSSGLSSLHRRRLEHHQLTLAPEAQVPVRTFEAFCDEQKVERIQFVKLDIEGHELFALQGAQRFLAREAIDIIQFEFGGSNIDSRTYWRDFYHLLSPRYRLYRILHDGLWPIASYRETDEIFVTTNYLAALPSYHAALLRH